MQYNCLSEWDGMLSAELLLEYTGSGKNAYALAYFDRGSEDASLYRIEPDQRLVIDLVGSPTHVCISGVAQYRTRYGQYAYMLEGGGAVGLEEGGSVALRFPYNRENVSGMVHIRVLQSARGPRAMCLAPARRLPRTRRALDMESLARRNIEWYTKDYSPAQEILRNIQLPRMNKLMIPGWTFMADMPVMDSSDAFFENMLTVGMRRYGVGREEYLAAGTRRRAVIAADAMQSLANHIVYITDWSISEEGKRTEIDWFSSLGRAISGGDCEDSAKEIVMLCRELQHREWGSELVASAADALRNYVCTMALGSVRGARLGDDDEGNILAHAFVFLVPRDTFEGLLDGDLMVDLPEPSRREALNPITLDGTNLKCVEDVEDRMPSPSISEQAHKLAIQEFGEDMDHAGDRIKAYTVQHDGFYLYVVSLLSYSVRCDEGRRAFQLFLRDGGVYGATFKDMCALREGLRLTPTVRATPDEVDACLAALNHYPPICAHIFRQDSIEAFKARVLALMFRLDDEARVLPDGGILVKGDGDLEPDTRVFASHEDAFTDDMLNAIVGVALAAEQLVVVPEYFSDTIYGLAFEISWGE